MFPNAPTTAHATHWVYDDPSGVPEGPLTVNLPQPLRGRVEYAAERAGVSASEWVLQLVAGAFRRSTIRVI